MFRLFLLALFIFLVWLGVIPVRYWVSKTKIWIQRKKFKLIVKAAMLFDIFRNIIN